VTLDQLPIGTNAVVERVEGERSFRRRLLELGILPGTKVRVLRIAPLGDPIEISSQGSNLSIRGREAGAIWVTPSTAQASEPQPLTLEVAGARD